MRDDQTVRAQTIRRGRDLSRTVEVVSDLARTGLLIVSRPDGFGVRIMVVAETAP